MELRLVITINDTTHVRFMIKEAIVIHEFLGFASHAERRKSLCE